MDGYGAKRNRIEIAPSPSSSESGFIIEEIVDDENESENYPSNSDQAKDNEPSSVSSPQDVSKEDHERSLNVKNEEDEILASSDTAEQEIREQDSHRSISSRRAIVCHGNGGIGLRATIDRRIREG